MYKSIVIVVGLLWIAMAAGLDAAETGSTSAQGHTSLTVDPSDPGIGPFFDPHGLKTDFGPFFDPGGLTPGTVVTRSKIGPFFDPHGLKTDFGPFFDPHGLKTDFGPFFDPDGLK